MNDTAKQIIRALHSGKTPSELIEAQGLGSKKTIYKWNRVYTKYIKPKLEIEFELLLEVLK
jgi:hypothetical protein